MVKWKLAAGGALVLMGVTQCVFPAYELEESPGGSGATSSGGSGSDVGGAGGAGTGGADASGGTGGGECEPSDRRCLADGVTPQECDDAGTWQDLDVCPAVCTNGQCEDTCDETTKQCASDDLLVCTGGVWETEESCAVHCNDLVDPPACSECVPEDQDCSTDNWVRTCDQSGAWVKETNCNTTSETCMASGSTASCEGECAPGQTTCVGWDVHQCADGTFQLETECSDPDHICDGDQCVANTQFNLGESGTSGWSNFSAAADIQYAVPVAVSERVRVENFRVRMPQGATNAVMGLYADNSGAPGSRLTNSGVITLGIGINDATPDSQVILEAGETYWITILFNVGVTFSEQDGGGYSADGSYPSVPNPYPLGVAGPTSKTYPLFFLARSFPE